MHHGTDAATGGRARFRSGALLCVSVWMLLAGALAAAQGGADAPPGAWLAAGLREVGRLVVWIVVPGGGGTRGRGNARCCVAPPAPEYRERTAAEFGQTAGSVGQTAGSVGQTAASAGQTAGSVGQTAGSTGQTMGNYQAGIASRNAGDVGSTAANFGVSTSDVSAAAAAANNVRALAPTAPRSAFWVNFAESARDAVADTRTQFVDVTEADLEQRLAATAGTESAPDVLVGNPLPAGWTRASSGLVGRFGTYPLWQTVAVRPTENASNSRVPAAPEASILAEARNPRAARLFVLWMYGVGAEEFGASLPNPKYDPLGAVAERAMRGLLLGGLPGADADNDMARFDASALAAGALARYDVEVPADLRVRVALGSRYVKGPLALVSVRGVGYGARTLGVMQGWVLLRKDDGGRWRVLQMTPFVSSDAVGNAQSVLRNSGMANAPMQKDTARPMGITQAAPVDGDSRPARPELWWDNLGGATLQVVEWQRKAPEWTISNLYFVPDANSRLRTQVSARFAAQPGQYRWRVWSIGKDGTTVLSGWRVLNII